MPIKIKMPALSPTMETGTLAKWLVKEGDDIAAGDIIAEIETDKATMEVEAADDGKLGKILVKEGTEDVPVGSAIAVLLEEGEDKSAVEDYKPSKPGKKEEKKEDDKEEKKEQENEAEQAKDEGKKAEKDEDTETDAEKERAGENEKKQAGPAPRKDGERIKASPLARRIAKEKGIDLAALKGSGPGGRIVKADVKEARPSVASAAAGLAEMPLDAPKEEVKLTSVRKVIAKRLAESTQTIPHYYLTLEADITRLLALRKEINGNVQPNERVSVNDFIIKAAALALMRTPSAHVQWADDRIYRMQRADVSVAVAIPDGLITPIVRGADLKPLRAIAGEMKQLAKKARKGKLKPEDYQGGTFSVSNLGMFGIKHFTAVINPPQSGILAVGAGEERPVMGKDGGLENRTFMAMTGSFDHRVVDGAVGAKLMKAIKDLLERPAVLLY